MPPGMTGAACGAWCIRGTQCQSAAQQSSLRRILGAAGRVRPPRRRGRVRGAAHPGPRAARAHARVGPGRRPLRVHRALRTLAPPPPLPGPRRDSHRLSPIQRGRPQRASPALTRPFPRRPNLQALGFTRSWPSENAQCGGCLVPAPGRAGPARVHRVASDTVATLLKVEGFSLQGTSRTTEGARHPDRDAQFRYINAQVTAYLADGQPVISVDAKKKETLGNYAVSRRWARPGRSRRVDAHRAAARYHRRQGAGLSALCFAFLLGVVGCLVCGSRGTSVLIGGVLVG